MKKIYSILGYIRYIIHLLLNTNSYRLTKNVLYYLKNNNVPATDKQDIIVFLKRNIISVYNYKYTNEYKFRLPIVHCDKENGLKYVITPENRRLYFKRKMSSTKIIQMYNFLSSELDIRSPHSYFFTKIDTSKPLCVADIGAAEGNFSLKIIDNIETLFLFERNEEWIEALQATFKPWENKVHIINKYVSNKSTTSEISIDSFFEKKSLSLLKMDVEGVELSVLEGAKKTLAQQDVQILMCSYHNAEDEIKLSKFVAQYNYISKFSNGYIFPKWDYVNNPNAKTFQFRKGMIYARKEN